MWKGVVVAYIVVALCYFPVALIGYYVFGNNVEDDILISLEKPTWLIVAANLFVVIHVIGSYQIYAMPVFDMIETVLVRKLHFRPTITLRFISRNIYVAFTMFVAITFPFFGGLLGFFGGFAFAPTTYFLPCIMWLAIYKPKKFSLSWCTNWICIILGLLLMILSPIGGLRNIILQAKTYTNSCNNYNNPRQPNPDWDHTIRFATHIIHTHFVHQIRSHQTPHNRIQRIKGRGQETVHFLRQRHVVPPCLCQRPRVLARARRLREYKQSEYGARAVVDEETASDEDKERGEVVADEEEVAWEESDVVEEVHEEVGNAEVEDCVLGFGVSRGETAVLMIDEKLAKQKAIDDWLTVTSSRNAKWWYSAFHNVTAMVGAGVLGLPYALSELGWGPGVAILVLSWIITLYTLWQMVEMHEMVPGKRFDRYHELGQHAFGEKLGLYIVVPQQLIVEVGVNIVYMVTGGTSLKKVHDDESTSI
uniref:Amino acid transporter transmembrane domain-containing protein n=1 Tax=Fagus sylvatica TaxID=28930 RepID=A0A2N9G846_FAGSY